MKFAEHLAAHITPEWRKQYIQYEEMKSMLYKFKEEAMSPETTDTEIISRYFARCDEAFFIYCEEQLAKINTFFSEKIAEASRKFASLKSELGASEAESSLSKGGARQRRGTGFVKALFSDQDPQNQRKLHDLKLAFSEFYLSLILLQNYQTLNFTGFRKILKKHDKLFMLDSGSKWRQAKVEGATFYTDKQVDNLIKDTENVFTQRLEAGDRQRAMKRLRVPPLGEKQQRPMTVFRMGMFSGIFLVLISVVILSLVFTRNFQLGCKEWEPALKMYRGIFLVILCVFLLGVNTYGWRSSGVNNVLIFELDPRDHLTHHQLLEVACSFAVIWALSVLAYLYSSYANVIAFANPLTLVIFIVLYTLNPLKIFHYKARRWLLHVLFRIFTAPFHKVGFADFWLADQLNSLSTVLLDFEYMVCFYIFEINWTGDPKCHDPKVCGGVTYGLRPVIACLPAWFRFAQCLRRYRDTRLVFPHIVNAGKYSTTFFVVLFSSLNSAYKHQHGKEVIQNNVFFYLWLIAAVINTIYTFTWDIKMDWGLFAKNAGENRFLREEIVYAHKWYYYFAIIEDLILRLSWTLNISIAENGLVHNEILKSALASAEVFRRFIWNFFRLENEHLNNCGQFRAVRDISIIPEDTSDQMQLLDMMDKPDGVTNRRGHKLKTFSMLLNANSPENVPLLANSVEDRLPTIVLDN